MKRAAGARSNSSRSRQRRRNNKATGHSAEQRAYGQKMPILSLYKIYNIFELFLLHSQSYSHCQFLLQFHVHSSIPPLLQSLATSAGGGAAERDSPVNWQVKHRMWQAIGSHLAASDRMAPQILYPDAQLQERERGRWSEWESEIEPVET